MKSEIYWNGKKIVGRKKEGRHNYAVFEDGEMIGMSQLMAQPVRVICSICGCSRQIKLYGGKHSPLNKKYICMSCNKLGKKNSFYGKKHAEEFKKRLSSERKGTWCVGEKNAMYGVNLWDTYSQEKSDEIRKKISRAVAGDNNGFYGKTHLQKTIDIIKQKNKEFFDSLTDEEKLQRSKKISESQKKLFKDNPEKYIKDKKKAAMASVKSQKSYKINEIEEMVRDELKKRKLDFEYSVILGYKQFDFGNKKYRILLEVQGDYWHGSSLYYGKGKRKLNKTQLLKQAKDAEKKKFVNKHGFKIFYIWENDIRKNNFDVIDEIEEYINEQKMYSM